MRNFSVADLLLLIFDVRIAQTLFCAASCMQIVFWIWEWAGNTAWPNNELRPSPAPEKPESMPSCSIIICARNEQEYLKQNLPEILNQQYPGALEIVIVDDDSTDGSHQLIADFQQRYPNLRYIRIADKKHPGKKQALEAGVMAASFENLLLTDADCRPATSGWAAGMMATLTNQPETTIVLGYSPFARTTGFLNKWSRFETAHTALLYCSLANAGMPYMGVGRNLAYRRTVFIQAGGFDDHTSLTSGDDDLLVNAAATTRNVKICLKPETFMYTAGKSKWKDWFRQKRRQLGAGFHYRIRHRIILGLISASQTIHYGLGLPLLFTSFSGWVWAFYTLRLLAVMLAYRKILNLLHEPGIWNGLPLYDGMMALYYGLLLPWVALSGGRKSTRWT